MAKSTYPTLREIIDAQTLRREYIRYLPLARYVLYPIGYSITWLAVRIGLTTEAVAWISGIVGFIGVLFLMSSQDCLLPIGIGLLILFNILDCVDGSIARTMNTQNPYGRFLDSLMGWIDMGFWALIGITSFRHPHLLLWPDPLGKGVIVWLAVGGLACYFFNLLGHVEKVFDQYVRKEWENIRADSKTDSKGISRDGKTAKPAHGNTLLLTAMRIISKINHNLRVRETHYFLLILAYLSKAIDLLLITFLFYYIMHVILLLVIYCKRGRQLCDFLKKQQR
jgi:hypothetical protein